jgi:putative hydrolase of the HAD superfamily
VSTLIHPDPPAPLVYAAVGQRFGSRLTPAEITLRFYTAFESEEAFDRAHDLRTSEGREVERWRRIVGTVLDDVCNAEACFQELFTHFSRPEAWRCDPDAPALFRTLSGRGYQLGLASNYDERLRRLVQGLPALRAVAHLVISSEVGWRKPAAGFFEAVCRRVERPAAQILLVGDDWVNDYEGAQAVGMQAVLFDPAGKRATPGIRRITRWTDLIRDLTAALS